MKTPSILVVLAMLALCRTQAQVPSILNYQGRVTVGGTNLTTNAAHFKFALVDGSGAAVFWKNDGTTTTNEPANSVSVAVEQGSYSTLLGDTSLVNMAALPPTVFTNGNVNLRVWFSAGGTNPFVKLSPDQRIAAAGYALRAATADSVAITNISGDFAVTGTLRVGQIVGGSNSSASSFSAVVAGGLGNTAAADHTLVGGGQSNSAGASYATVVGGHGNSAGTNYAAVGGGRYNSADGEGAAVSGGQSNSAVRMASMVGGGLRNTAQTAGSTVSGGEDNTAGLYFVFGDNRQLTTIDNTHATVGGGQSNNATGEYSAIIGGSNNMASGYISTVGGGFGNKANANYAAVFGGFSNTASGQYSAVGGGDQNAAGGQRATVAGGLQNQAPGEYGAVGGGYGNLADNGWATVGGGYASTASGLRSTVAGGKNNLASGFVATVGGGEFSSAQGNYSTVSGGYINDATGLYSTVPGGARAKATNSGSFVWSGDDSENTASWADNTFTIRCEGGARFYTANGTGVGVSLAASGTSWASLSDSNSKTDFETIKPREILSKVAAMPVTSWHYKHDLHRRYIGPMAQDFHAAFGLGSDDKTISTLDSDGVMYAAIQGLVEELQDRDAQMLKRDKTIEELKSELRQIREQLSKLPPSP